ncbi:hypothetical protein NKG94_36300 [Micromonospora sp. M12]
MHDRPCYEVEFSDGTVIVADAGTCGRRRVERVGGRPARQRRHWSESSLANVRVAHETFGARQNQPITLFDTIAHVGPEFRHVLHTVAAEVGSVGRVSRPVVRGGKTRNWSAPAIRPALF